MHVISINTLLLTTHSSFKKLFHNNQEDRKQNNDDPVHSGDAECHSERVFIAAWQLFCDGQVKVIVFWQRFTSIYNHDSIVWKHPHWSLNISERQKYINTYYVIIVIFIRQLIITLIDFKLSTYKVRIRTANYSMFSFSLTALRV